MSSCPDSPQDYWKDPKYFVGVCEICTHPTVPRVAPWPHLVPHGAVETWAQGILTMQGDYCHPAIPGQSHCGLCLDPDGAEPSRRERALSLSTLPMETPIASLVVPFTCMPLPSWGAAPGQLSTGPCQISRNSAGNWAFIHAELLEHTVLLGYGETSTAVVA